ncbi:MAG: AAA family ATPase [Gammaproteobacteria bacterium]
MLRRLEITNYFSIKDKQCLDFAVANNVPDIPGVFGETLGEPVVRVPKVIVLFGANASGKTTVLRALAFLRRFVQSSFLDTPDTPLPVMPFCDNEHCAKPTVLTVDFDGDFIKESPPCVYRYTLELDYSQAGSVNGDQKIPSAVVKREALYYAPSRKFRRLFERNGIEVKGSNEFKLRKNNYPAEIFRPNASVISALKQYGHKIATDITERMNTIQTNVNFHKHEFQNTNATQHYALNPHVLEKLNQQIGLFDLGIEDVSIDTKNGKHDIRFKHTGLNIALPYSLESQGTQRFYNMFAYLDFAHEAGGLAIMDEIDVDLHPSLLPEIIAWYRDSESNPENAQIIMACHNTSLMEHLEKEEIYFTEKSITGETKIYGLKDIEGVRRNENFYKKYMAGEYGALPGIG